MSQQGLASSVGLRAAARFWNAPAEGGELAWARVMAKTPGLAPLARAARSWGGVNPGQTPLLESWVQASIAEDVAPLRSFLRRGCRDAMPDRRGGELAGWLDQWDAESAAMQLAWELVESRPRRPLRLAMAVAAAWTHAQQGAPPLCGIRRAFYRVTDPGDLSQEAATGLVLGENLTDRLCGPR